MARISITEPPTEAFSSKSGPHSGGDSPGNTLFPIFLKLEKFRVLIVGGGYVGLEKIRAVLNNSPQTRITLVGATTRSGLLISPLRARFGITSRLEYYDAKRLQLIILRASDILKMEIEDEAAFEIARRSRGTPRIANSLLRRVRDFAQIKGNGKVDMKIAQYALSALNVDEFGLDEMDNRILTVIIDKFKGGPVGINTLSTAVGEEAGTIEEVYEPFLIMEGFLMRTPRGREVTEKAYKHLNKVFRKNAGTLFEE